MNGLRPAAALTATLAVLAGASATAADAPRVSLSDQWTTAAPGAASGRMYTGAFFDPQDASRKPVALAHAQLELPAGARFDTDAVEQCGASNAALTARGPAACPHASELGTDVVEADTGFPGPARYLTFDVTYFNAPQQVIIVSQERHSAVRDVFRGTVSPTTLDIAVPLMPGTPPDGGAMKHEHEIWNAVSTPRGNYLTTPPTCPRTHAWVEHTTLTFRDGSLERIRTTIPCKRR